MKLPRGSRWLFTMLVSVATLLSACAQAPPEPTASDEATTTQLDATADPVAATLTAEAATEVPQAEPPTPTPTLDPNQLLDRSPLHSRYYACSVWDEKQDQLIVHGGISTRIHNEVLVFRPGDQTAAPQVVNADGPARSLHTCVWESESDRMLAFGGQGAGAAEIVNNNILSFDPAANQWEQIVLAGAAPPPKSLHSAVWDPVHDQMLAFGGQTRGPGGISADLWSFDPAARRWKLLRPQGERPEKRISYTAVWDSERERMLVFGGWDYGDRLFNDLWSYDPAANLWQKLDPEGPRPHGRFRLDAIWDNQAQRLVVFGGCCTPEGFMDDMWAYSASENAWSRIVPEAGWPAPRMRHTMAWDPGRGELYMFGGVGDCFGLGDLWAFDSGASSWRRIASSGPRPAWARQGHSMFYSDHAAGWDAETSTLYVFGGTSTYGAEFGMIGLTNDLWAYQEAENRWARIDVEGEKPGPRDKHTAVWDPVRRQLLVFGGIRPGNEDPGSTYLQELWVFDPEAKAWSEITPTGSAP